MNAANLLFSMGGWSSGPEQTIPPVGSFPWVSFLYSPTYFILDFGGSITLVPGHPGLAKESDLMPEHTHKSFTILRRKQVQERTGLSRSTIYMRIAQGTFPKAISLGDRAVGWVDSEIDAWLANQLALSRNTT
jgi:prophage regulatory protein